MKNKSHPVDLAPALAQLSPEDWRSFNNAGIARKTGCSYSAAKARRERLIHQEREAGRSGDAYVSSASRLKRQVDPAIWARITPLDWQNKSNALIAATFGCRFMDAKLKRRELISKAAQSPNPDDSYAFIKPAMKRILSKDWTEISPKDWQTRHNSSIASKTNFTIAEVRNKREQIIAEARKNGGTGGEFVYKRPK